MPLEIFTPVIKMLRSAKREKKQSMSAPVPFSFSYLPALVSKTIVSYLDTDDLITFAQLERGVQNKGSLADPYCSLREVIELQAEAMIKNNENYQEAYESIRTRICHIQRFGAHSWVSGNLPPSDPMKKYKEIRDNALEARLMSTMIENARSNMLWTQSLKASQMIFTYENDVTKDKTKLREECGCCPIDISHEHEKLVNAALLGHPIAQFELGICYMHGCVEKFAFEWALFWLSCSQMGYHQARFCLATCLAFPNAQCATPSAEFPQDHEFIMFLYESAGREGNLSALVNLGMIYYGKFPGWSQDVNQKYCDVDRAVRIWKIAARAGQAEALLNLGHVKYTGHGDHPVNQTEAFAYWYKAAELGEPRGQFLTALCYLKGTGVQTDIASARGWFLKAALQNSNLEVSENAQQALGAI